jgi:hypothetical protein
MSKQCLISITEETRGMIDKAREHDKRTIQAEVEFVFEKYLNEINRKDNPDA